MADIVVAYVVMAYVVMAYVAMACIAMACVVMAYIVMAYIVMAYIVMAYIVMAYVVMAYMSPTSGTSHTGAATVGVPSSISAPPRECPLRGYGRAGTQNDRLSEAVILSTGTPIPAQRTCRRRCRYAGTSHTGAATVGVFETAVGLHTYNRPLRVYLWPI